MNPSALATRTIATATSDRVDASRMSWTSRIVLISSPCRGSIAPSGAHGKKAMEVPYRNVIETDYLSPRVPGGVGAAPPRLGRSRLAAPPVGPRGGPGTGTPRAASGCPITAVSSPGPFLRRWVCTGSRMVPTQPDTSRQTRRRLIAVPRFHVEMSAAAIWCGGPGAASYQQVAGSIPAPAQCCSYLQRASLEPVRDVGDRCAAAPGLPSRPYFG